MPALEPMKKGTKMNTDSDYLTEDIPTTKDTSAVPVEGKDDLQKLKSLCSTLKLHVEKSSIETTKGEVSSYAITYPKKVKFNFQFFYKLNKLGYTLVIDSTGKYKMHFIKTK